MMPDIPRTKTRGRKTARVVSVLATMAEETSAVPSTAALGFGTPLLVAVDVFQNHDGVVHQHADPQSQTAQGHDIQGEAAEIDQGEGGDDGDGNG